MMDTRHDDLRQRRPVQRMRAAALVLLLAACGGGSEVLVVPLFLFGFGATVNFDNTEYRIGVFFNPDTPTSANGEFSSVNVSVNETPAPATSGSFEGCSLSLSISGSPPTPLARQYSGRFISPDVIRLTPSGNTGLPVIEVARLGTAADVPDCP